MPRPPQLSVDVIHVDVTISAKAERPNRRTQGYATRLPGYVINGNRSVESHHQRASNYAIRASNYAIRAVKLRHQRASNYAIRVVILRQITPSASVELRHQRRRIAPSGVKLRHLRAMDYAINVVGLRHHRALNYAITKR